MNPILGLVGPSGSGKSTLIKALVAKHPDKLEISRSLTSRPQRGEEDGLFYDFTTADDIKQRQARGQLTHFAEYAGNLYATDRLDLEKILSSKLAIAALVEDGVRALRAAGYDVVVIKVIPAGYKETGDETRRIADRVRADSGLQADHEIVNSFDPGGLENSLNKLENLISNVIQSSHVY
jgi:guanylate kinase